MPNGSCFKKFLVTAALEIVGTENVRKRFLSDMLSILFNLLLLFIAL